MGLGQHMQHGMYLQVLASVYPCPRHIAPLLQPANVRKCRTASMLRLGPFSNSFSIVWHEVSHSSQFVYKVEGYKWVTAFVAHRHNRATSPFGPLTANISDS
jgi:hypothetical protein